MVYRKLPIQLSLRLLAIVLIALGIGLPWPISEAILPKVVLGLIELWLCVTTVYYVNKTNRSLAYFFEAVKNNDSSIYFPHIKGFPSFSELHRQLNIINELIQEIKVEAGYKEKFYETLIEHSATGLISYDASNREIEIINDTARRLLDIEYTISPGILQRSFPELYVIISDIMPGQTRLLKLRKGYDLAHLSVRCSLVKYHDKSLKLVSLSNIGQELDEKEIESWQRLTSVLTHEIMNSIAPITSLSATLMKLFRASSLTMPDKQSEELFKNTADGLSIIEERGKSLMEFVKNYRSIANVPLPKIDTIDSRSWKENLRLLLNHDIKQNKIPIEITVAPDVKEIYADEKQLNQVMINLIKNSTEACQDVAEPLIAIHVYRNAYHKTTISIKDNGGGIPPEVVDNVFIPFYTTKEDGSGIGLSLSKQIVRMHGGSLRLVSEYGIGTTCLIELNLY